MDLPRRPVGSDLLAERAGTSPSATALLRTTDGNQWTYRELDEAVERTAGLLAAAGLDEGDRIGLFVGNRVAFLRVLYAGFRLGATVVPYNLELADAALATLVDRSDPDLLVTEADTVGLAGNVGGDRPIRSVDPVDECRPLRERSVEGYDPVDARADTVRLLLYTSGTTGEPKGVRLTAGNLRASAVASAFRLGVDPGDRWLAPLPAYHMGGLAPHLRSTLYGTTAVLQPAFDAEATLAAMAEFDVTCVSLVPTAVKRLLDAGDPPSGLRFVLCGGAPTPQSLVDQCADRDVPLCPTYGMTETASQVATALPETAREHDGTVGTPLHWTTVTIVDGDGTSLPPGEEGEVVVAGPTVTPGYDDASGAEGFGDDAFHTGDLGYRDEAGRLWVTGRVDELILTGGENVAPATVRRALESGPGIDTAAVVGLDDPEWGQRVAALVVPTDGADSAGDVDGKALAEHLRDRLASYELPKTVALADGLPRTASGTVDRAEVRERLRSDGVDFDAFVEQSR